MPRITIKWLEANYSKKEVMVPMRDGIRLYTAIYTPVSAKSAPLLMLRTPFQLKPYGPGRFDRKLRSSLAEFVNAGYIIVNQNVRGTYMSEGEFVNVRPDGKEQEDCFDTVEWLLDNTPCNGNVGVKGMSYPGFYAVEAALCGHPAIKAVSPQAPVTDWFMGDDLHHNGALMLNDVYGFGRFFFRRRRTPGPKSLPTRYEPTDDIRQFFLDRGTTAEILAPYYRKGGFWKEIMDHPHYDGFWKERNSAARLASAGKLPPLLFVGGTFDGEDCYGPQECFKACASRDDAYLVLGPWAHGAWLHKDFDHLADASLGDGLSEWFMKKIEYPFFAHYLEGKGRRPEAKIQIFPSKAKGYGGLSADTADGREPDDNMVLCSEEWPLQFAVTERLYPTEGKKLMAEPPSVGELSYISDPLNPVPSTETAGWITRDYMAADQSFLDRRKDILSFTSEKIKDTVCMIGGLTVSLKLKCSTDDADIVVDLIDIRPDGYKMLVRSDILPLRYRDTFSDPEPLVPGKETTVKIRLNAIAHMFESGHRIMFRVRSSCYPLFAMSAQRFLSNPLLAKAEDCQKAEISLVFGPETYIECDVM